jgi:CheY-like chemotaxis protein
VLVAQDDDVNAQVAMALLDRLGFAVDVVASGIDALRAWGTRPYDFVLVDQHLPDLDGLQVARCVRELERAEGRHITIVGLTAGNQPADRERCLASGMDATLPKPLDLGALTVLLARFASSSRDDLTSSPAMVRTDALVRTER